MKAFYFSLKSVFVLKIFKFMSWLFGCVEKRFDWENKGNFNIFEIRTWETNNCNARIAQDLGKKKQSGNENLSVDRT